MANPGTGAGERFYDHMEIVVGDGAAYLLAQAQGQGNPFEPVHYGTNYGKVITVDPATMAVVSTHFFADAPNLHIDGATAGGGLSISSPTSRYAIGGDSLEASSSDAVPIAPGVFAGWNSGPAMEFRNAGIVSETPMAQVRGFLGRNAAVEPWPSVRVDCRPVAQTLGFFDHCYLVARRSQSETRYIGSGPAPDGQNEAGDSATMSAEDQAALYTLRSSRKSVTPAAIDCLRNSVITWNDTNVTYHPTGPNSNTFVSWLVQECQVLARPNPFARALGWIEY